jgi:hypothetical protein
LTSLNAIDLLIKVSPQTVSVGLQKILSLLESEEPDVRVHAVKVVANLAAEGKLHKFFIRYKTATFLVPELHLLYGYVFPRRDFSNFLVASHGAIVL